MWTRRWGTGLISGENRNFNMQKKIVGIFYPNRSTKTKKCVLSLKPIFSPSTKSFICSCSTVHIYSLLVHSLKVFIFIK